MKIIGQSDSGWILMAAGNEVAKIMGFYASYDSDCPPLKVGVEINVSQLYKCLSAMRKSEETLAACVSSLRNLADLLGPVDRLIAEALKEPEAANEDRS